MTRRVPCPPAPAPLEADVRQFDDCFASLAQRRACRDYLHGLLLPRERTKTLTGLAGTEPDIGAQASPAQRLQWFLSESAWDAEAINTRRLELLCADAATRPREAGVLIIDETGDRKDGKKTAHVAHQYLGSVGKIANGIAAVSSVWADADVYYPLNVQPYTPACRFPKGKSDPAFRTKPQIAVELVDAALEVGFTFRAVVADCLYGERAAFVGALWEAGLPFVLALRARQGRWAPAEAAHTPEEAAREVPWASPQRPGGWTPGVRRFRDGHRETWWAADLALAGEGPDQPTRLVVATTDPTTLPAASTWYLTTNLPRPGSPRGCTGCGSGWSRATSRSSRNAAGPTGRCAPTERSTDTGSWSTAPSPSAGGPGAVPRRRPRRSPTRKPTSSPPPDRLSPRRRGGGKMRAGAALHAERPNIPWAVAPRRVQAWLHPWTMLWRWWRAWSALPPPPPLQALLDWLWRGHPLDCYAR